MPQFVTQGGSVWQAVPFLACFLIVATAAGRRILVCAGTGANVKPSERGVIAAALGIGILQFIPFALGVVRVLHPLPLRVALAVVFLATLPDAIVVVRGVVHHATLPRGWLVAWLVALLPAVAIWCLGALAPTIDADSLIYHLTVPKRWLQLGCLAYLPTYPYSNAPMGGEMLYAIAMVWAGDSGAKLVHLAVGLLAAASL